MELAIAKKFDGVLQRSNQCGVPNAKVRYDQYGNVVVSEERDYLGTLVAAVRVDPQGKPVRAWRHGCGSSAACTRHRVQRTGACMHTPCCM